MTTLFCFDLGEQPITAHTDLKVCSLVMNIHNCRARKKNPNNIINTEQLQFGSSTSIMKQEVRSPATGATQSAYIICCYKEVRNQLECITAT